MYSKHSTHSVPIHEHKTPRSTGAANKVLGTNELLEAILLCLPARDILLGQRVSRTWHDAVTRSPILQRALFLAPAHGETVRFVYGRPFPQGKSKAVERNRVR